MVIKTETPNNVLPNFYNVGNNREERKQTGDIPQNPKEKRKKEKRGKSAMYQMEKASILNKKTLLTLILTGQTN